MLLLPRCLGLWSAVFLTLLTSTVQSQPSSLPSSLADQEALAQQARRQITTQALAASGVPLEGALDPEAYMVGPGDVFSVSIGGAIPLQLTSTVTADGVLAVPELGSFQVDGLTLAAVRERVSASLQRAYRNVPTSVALAQPRQFYVHVSGLVDQPGRHVMVPIARVEDALAAAVLNGSPLLTYQIRRQSTPRYPDLPALRNVEVHRRDGQRLVVDLRRYYATGDTRYNPYLRDGDALYVPSFRRSGDAVFVEREGRQTPWEEPALFDFRPGDTVTDLLLVAGGEELVAETETVRLLRVRPDRSIETLSLSVADVRAGTAPDVPLQPQDRLQLPNLEQGLTATVAGQVRHPGTYPIVPGTTTLRDLVEAAGGLRPDGLLRGAYLERRYTTVADEPAPEEALAFDPTTMRDLIEVEELRRNREAFETARLSALPFGSRQYFAREMLEFQRVSLDLSVGDIPAIPLRDGDRFVVPRDPDAVLVVGQVSYPGYVPFTEGAEADDYISQAGGLGPAATEVYVREASGVIRPPGASSIRSGDIVFVDRTPTADTAAEQLLALQERQEESNRRFRYIQAALTLLGTAAGVLTAVIFTNNRNSNGN